MDDLEQKLTSLLGDPAAMERVQSLLRSLGAPDDPAAASVTSSAPAPPEANASPEPAAPPEPDPTFIPPPEPAAQAPAAGAPDLSGLLELLGSMSAPAPVPEPPSAAPPLGGLLSQLTPLLSSSASGNPDAALLQALKPYLHGEREKRLDEALHIMRLTQLLPLLRL